jgi:two-component system cell cycle sensor histidine kinase/response regulator CckA
MQSEMLEAKVRATRSQLEDVLFRANGDGAQPSVAFGDALRLLDDALQELEVAAEEARQQHDELAATGTRIEEDRQRYRVLFDDAPDAYVVTDAWGIIEEANHRAGALLGTTPRELADTPLAGLMPQDQVVQFSEVVRGLRRGEERRRWITAVRPVGQRGTRTVEIDVTPAHDRGAAVVAGRRHRAT